MGADLRDDVDDRRRADVELALSDVPDPCMSAIGLNITLTELGVISGVQIDEGTVEVRLLPTSPGCLLLGVFQSEITRRLKELPWCTGVSFELSDHTLWGEERLGERARQLLMARRADQLRQLGVARSPASSSPS
jgi:metal-sulfur cluster biosynthetic enzyme